ncbi:MAG: hypothetical protein F7C35_00715 [Desulfurococcales archaeon]|nr:hypothetical protein [Desulfurococcales archaeon]
MFRKRKKQTPIKDPNVIRLIEYYMERTGKPYEEALAELVKKGYDYWLIETKYTDKSVGHVITQGFIDRYSTVLHAYFTCKLKLREAYDDLRKLTLTLSSLLAEVEHGGLRGNRLELEDLRRRLTVFYERYVKKLSAEEEDGVDMQEILQDLERILNALRKQEDGDKKL